jgi:hypothetical protein
MIELATFDVHLDERRYVTRQASHDGLRRHNSDWILKFMSFAQPFDSAGAVTKPRRGSDFPGAVGGGNADVERSYVAKLVVSGREAGPRTRPDPVRKRTLTDIVAAA